MNFAFGKTENKIFLYNWKVIAMEFKDVIKNRYSCRKYTNKAVDESLLRQCVETAMLALSACNSQPWKFYVINSENLKSEFVKLTQPFTKNASFIVVEEDSPSLQCKIVNKIKDQDFSKVDVGIACSYLCLQASELGLATCIIGYLNEPLIKQRLGLSEKKRIRLVIIIGFAHETYNRHTKRKDIDKILKVF